jgi:two-component system sensor histidine kinase RpfC
VCRLTVLVAEDNFTTQRLIAAILERAGHAVHVVENGRAAAEAIAKGAYDAVLMDVDLPVWNGMEAAGLIRFMSTGRPRVPIVALLAQPDPSAHNRCAEADFHTWIEKPIEPARLLAVLAAIAPALGTRGASERPVAKAAAAAPAASNSSSLDVRTLESLKALGGDDFVEELAQQFIDDAAGVRRELARAAASADVHAFREHAHALRSGAANIGAQGVHDLCLAWRHIDRATLSSKGQSCLQELEREFERFGAALQDYGAYRARLRSAQTSARVEHTALAG